MALEVSIQKKYPGFSLDVAFRCDGGHMGILGASGCGKSMTLKCIAGVLKPDSGRIVLDGKVLFDSKQKINLPPQQRGVGYLFQNYALFPTMTVEQNIGVSLKGSKKDHKERIREIIRQYQLEGLEKRFPSQLSGGQQQRVALARMLITNPKMIMLDEPFSALDGFLKDMLQQQLLEMLETYTGEVLLVSHSRDEVYKFCEKAAIVSDGNVLLSGNTKDIFANPQMKEAARITGCKNISKAEKIGEYEIYASEWRVRLKTAETVGDDIQYVAIRGHQICEARSAKEENAMAVKQVGFVDAPFEYQYIVEHADGGAPIWWMTPKMKGKENSGCKGAEYIQLPKEELMLLRG